jgi:hypothetical protein
MKGFNIYGKLLKIFFKNKGQIYEGIKIWKEMIEKEKYK